MLILHKAMKDTPNRRKDAPKVISEENGDPSIHDY